MMFQEINEAILYYNSQGTPVHIPGIGTFSPSIDRDGNIKVNLRADVTLRQDLNSPRTFTGVISNSGNIGLDNAAYKAMWDQVNPDDPLEI